MRTTEQINKEYSSLCGEAGDLNFKRSKLNSRLEEIYKQLHTLVEEFDGQMRPENTFPEKAP